MDFFLWSRDNMVWILGPGEARKAEEKKGGKRGKDHKKCVPG